MKAYRILYPYIIGPSIDLKEAAGGKWAVITGSTDGIGKAYACQLARKGFDIILVSRSPSKLDSVREEIMKESKVEVKTIPFDFTSTDVETYQKTLLGHFDGLDIGILVNNVGMSYEYPEVLHKVDGGLTRLANVDIVNTLPATLLSATLLKCMVEKNRGIIVNVSSAAGYYPMSMWGVYSASKAYVSRLSEILRLEYADKDIIIQTVCPMLVSTKMSKVRPSFFSPSPDDFVLSAIRSIGLISETRGCLAHQIQGEIMDIIPSFFLERYVSSQSVLLNKKAVAKKTRQEAPTE